MLEPIVVLAILVCALLILLLPLVYITVLRSNDVPFNRLLTLAKLLRRNAPRTWWFPWVPRSGHELPKTPQTEREEPRP